MKNLLLAFLSLVAIIAFHPTLASAATQSIITVDSLADEMVEDDNCTLREAVEAANTNKPVDRCRAGSPVLQDTIIFRLDGTILLQDSLVITQGVEIRGNGQNSTILDGEAATLSQALVFSPWLEGNPNVALTRLTIQNAHRSSGPGGAIQSGSDVSLTLDHVTLRLNSASNGGGLKASGDVTVRQSQFLNNTVTVSGGALSITNGTISIEQSVFQDNIAQVSGGALYLQEGTAAISHSTFSYNRAESDLSTGGGLNLSSSAVTITHSAIINNHAGSNGGGLRLASSQVSITNSTISGNSSRISYGGGITAEINSTLDLRNSTIAANTPVGIDVANSTVILQDTIIGENEGQNCSTLFDGVIQSSGHNLVDFNGYDFYSCQLNQPTDIATEEALFVRTIGPLQDNGGPTLTHALLPGSQAVDTGSCSSLNVTDDQRGVARPHGAACDIGAFESSFLSIYLPLALVNQ